MANQKNLVPLGAPPGVPSTALEPEFWEHINSLGLLRVRIKVGDGAAVTLRPWYERDGEWWPLRFDAAENVGTEGVTADPNQNQGKAEALYACAGLSSAVCLVVESGDADDVVLAYIEPAYIDSNA